ncbi:MAG: 5'-nucleotidase C-terminal domain-containing protein [Bacteroidales bacterium]|nr:5'-nucleotidase C-terminal domain-containing protein [Bacteroidales bacterium]
MKKILLILTSIAVICAAVWYFSKGQCHADLSPEVKSVELCHMDSTRQGDPQMEAEISVYRDSLDHVMKVKLCDNGETMIARRPESALSRFLADVILFEIRRMAVADSMPTPDFSLINLGGIRSFLPAGPVFIEDVFCIAPFENSPVVLCLDSADVMAMMDHIATRGGEGIAGASMTIANKKAKDVKIGGMPLQGGRVYRLATLDYLANGGDGFSCLVGKQEYESGMPFRDTFINYLKTIGDSNVVLCAPVDNRITVEK